MKPYPFHPHILKPSQTPQQNPDSSSSSPLICTACEDPIPPNSPIHTCPKPDCQFALHKTCFHLPKTLTHAAHPAHALTLLAEPPAHALYYNCNACGDLINAFSFYCQECDFRLHVKCAHSLLDSADCKAHVEHGALAVKYQVPDKEGYEDYSFVTCDVCAGCLTKGYWCYGCKECDFCCHLECAFAAEEGVKKEEEVIIEDEEDEEGLSNMERLHRANIRAMNQRALLNFQVEMAKLNAYTISMI